jgi:N-acetylmuramoyl-L-alanine amidase
MDLIDTPSPNFGPRADGAAIDMLIVHYTGMADCAGALARLCTEGAGVSAHYLVDEDGGVHRLVSEDARAWHAGEAYWAGERDVNSRSIGIELVNPGHEFGYRPFPDAQMTAFIDLAADIVARHGIRAGRVLGHSDVAPLRKTDPGELFDWARCARAGIGLFPPPGLARDRDTPDRAALMAALQQFGYDAHAGNTAITAFRRHFRPQTVDGGDAEAPVEGADQAVIGWLLAQGKS